MREFRFHGRGGQGVVILSKLVARLFFQLGKHVKEFPKFGVERRGAPVEGYVRVDEVPIDLNCQIYHPDTVVVMAESILDSVDVTAGMQAGSLIVVNSAAAPEAFADRLPGFRVATVDASQIALRHGLGTPLAPIANTSIFGAFAALEHADVAQVEQAIRGELKRPGPNIDAAREAHTALSEVQLLPGEPLRRAAPPPRFTYLEDLPELAYSLEDARANRTGSWRSQRPRYAFKVAPCNSRCPAGNDVRGFLQALADDDPAAALGILLQTSPLPGVCGRVCPHPCEDECNRLEMDGAVPVSALERYVEAHAGSDVHVQPAAETGKRVTVVGSGPAGLSAAWQLGRRGHRVTVLEAASQPGGMLALGIPAYRLPRAVLTREIERIEAVGVQIRCGVRVGIDVSLDALLDDADAVIVATGQPLSTGWKGRGLELAGIEQGLDFLQRHNLGQPVDVGERVVVVGGGNTAIDVAGVVLRRSASRQVRLLYRRSRAQMPAIRDEVEQILKEGAELIELASPVEALAGADGRVRALVCQRMRLGDPDAGGRPRPVPIPDSTFELPCDQVILAIGQRADLSFAGDLQLQPDRVDTGRERLYVCGDVSTGAGTVTAAIGSGRAAALQVHAALGGQVEPATTSWAPQLDEILRAERINRSHFDPQAPGVAPRLQLTARLQGFDEVVGEIAAGSDEAKRCLSCGTCTACDNCYVWCPEPAVRRENGVYVIDTDYCKGCGVCLEECPRGVIDMVEETL